MRTQHAARSTQHAARSTQHAARSTQHAARTAWWQRPFAAALTLLAVAPIACGGEHDASERGGTSSPVLFGADGRKNVVAFAGDKQVLQWTDSVAVLGRTPGLTGAVCAKSATSNRCYFDSLPRTKGPLPDLSTDGLCSDQAFAKERWAGDCTAFRVGDRLFVTAGHCVGPDNNAKLVPQCSQTELAFGFQVASFNTKSLTPAVPSGVRRSTDVYKCTKIIAHRVPDPKHTDPDRRDYAIFEVDRPVRAHHLLRVRTLDSAQVGDVVTQLGHGLNLPLKVVPGAEIKLIPSLNANFEYSADAFGGDSGGPVIDTATGLVSGIVSERPGTTPGGEFQYDAAASCYRYGTACDLAGGCPAFPGDPKFTLATDILNASIKAAIPKPAANPKLFADLDLDGTPDEVSLAVVGGFYALDVQMSAGTCPFCPILTPIPALVPPVDLSPAIHIGDFNGDQYHDVLVMFEGAPPAYVDGKSLTTFNPFSLAQSFLSGGLFSPLSYSSFSVGDFNGDAVDDLRVQTSSGNVRTFMGSREGTLSTAGLAPALEVPPECGEGVSVASNWSSVFPAWNEYQSTRAVAVVPADAVGVFGGGTLLAIDCPGATKKNQIKFLDPRSGDVKKTISVTGSTNWRSFAYRSIENDLLGLSSDPSPTGNYTVSRIPLSSASSAASQTLIVRKQDGIATGVGWNATAKRIRVLVDSSVPRIDRFATNHTFLLDDAVDVSPCIVSPNYEKAPIVGGLAVSGEVEVGACSPRGLGRNKMALLDLDVVQGSKRVVDTQYELILHDIECDPLTFDAEMKTVVWGVARSGRVLRAFEVDGATCGFAGFPPASKLCVKPGNGQPETVALYPGANGSFFRGADGRVWAAGDNSLGQLGLGGIATVATPTLVPGLQGARSVSGGSAHSLAVLANGTLVATGDNSHGQLGRSDVASTASPLPVPGLAPASAVAAGEGFSVALLEDGTVWAWGANDSGQLGDGTTASRTAPAPVALEPGAITAVAAGSRFALALDAAGQIWAWGANDSGQLGNGDPAALSATPVRVEQRSRADEAPSAATRIAAGGAHALAILTGGTVVGWGANSRGQLGRAPSGPAYLPAMVPGLSGAEALAAGASHSAAVNRAGDLVTWGANDHGQLGDGTTVDRSAPAAVRNRCSRTGVIRAASALAAGSAHTLALGSVLAWGKNDHGQLGVGTLENAPEAMDVSFNHAPSCAGATASPGVILWPPNGSLFDVNIGGVVDPDGDPLDVQVTGVDQDEPLQAPGQGSMNPDAVITQGKLKLRAERSGKGDGRVYHVRFRASDPTGATCTGVLEVCVPHNGTACGDGGPLYVSTAPPAAAACVPMGDDVDECERCARMQCCAELTACMGDPECTSGGPDGRGEAACMRDCLVAAAGAEEPLALASASCASLCATKPKLAPKTLALVSCLGGAPGSPAGGQCSAECYGGAG